MAISIGFSIVHRNSHCKDEFGLFSILRLNALADA
jgi:hypothetical protein